MREVWQPCWLATPASMVGNHFVRLAILPRLHTSFLWAAPAKTYSRLWKGFEVRILCAVRVEGEFESRSRRITTRVMSTHWSKSWQEDEYFERRGGAARLRPPMLFAG